VDAKTVYDELQEIFGDQSEGALAGMVRLIVVDRLNALIVITPQAKYLQTARSWIERLDRAEESSGRNMYVYPIENGRAENLAALLQQLLGTPSDAGGSGSLSPSPTLAAGQDVAVAESGGATAVDLGDVKIVADIENNALLILASREDYSKIRAAIRQIDQIPMQVLVEASIVEVTLTGDLSYGLQWFFKHHFDGDTGRGELFPLPVDPSFSYTVTDESAVIRAVLNTLASESRLNVVSSPSLMVLDNHSAIIKVGDQVPDTHVGDDQPRDLRRVAARHEHDSVS
jgi:general secretion pathway protein D